MSGQKYSQYTMDLGAANADARNNPIEQLVGLKTTDGWFVAEKVEMADTQTGGCFSIGYKVEHEDGRRGFLKALDFQEAQNEPDPPRALQRMLATFNFERDLLELCGRNKMSRVVRALSNGSFDVPGAPLDQVYYLIFELAEGDARTQSSKSAMRDYGWSATMCHQIAVGLRQLHNFGITHQDLKPSNILVFESGQESKLADLGRAHCTTFDSPHDDNFLPGAATYAPPEQLYRFEGNDRLVARRSADLYLLGSMIMFAFTGTPMTPSIVAELRSEHRPFFLGHVDGWRGFFNDVLPYVVDAWSTVIDKLEEQLQHDFPSHLHERINDLCTIVKYLTNPDPGLRGDPQNRIGGNARALDLERTVSKLAQIAATLRFMKRIA